MSQKDGWDKIEILIKLIASIVLVAIPIVIKVGADQIGQAMERGKLVDSLLAELTDEDKQIRRDMALIALDAAVLPPQRCRWFGYGECTIEEDSPDLVSDVAILLWRDLDDRDEQAEAAKILKRRKPKTHGSLLVAASDVTSGVDPDATSASDRQQKAQKAEIIAQIVAQTAPAKDDSLAGIRLVYIQYQTNRDRAVAVQEALRGKGVSAPGIDRVPSIPKSDIRYPGPAEREAAERLRAFLNTEIQLGIDTLVDLSRSGYTVPNGQFEVWLKD